MEIRLKWETEEIEDHQKNSYEKEVKKKVSDFCESCIGTKPDCLAISLFKSKQGKLLFEGSVFLCEEEKEVMKLQMDHGLLVTCNGDGALYTPGSLAKK